jgi:hypothetical protein
MSDNSLTHLPTDSFSGLPMVETIDLEGNNLKEIDPSVFRDGMGKTRQSNSRRQSTVIDTLSSAFVLDSAEDFGFELQQNQQNATGDGSRRPKRQLQLSV